MSFVSRGMKPIEFQRGCARNSKWKSVENRNRDGREYRNDRSKTNSVVITHENPSVELRTFFSGFPLLRRIDPTGNIIPFVRSVSEKWPRIPWTDASISVKFSEGYTFFPLENFTDRRKRRSWEGNSVEFMES